MDSKIYDVVILGSGLGGLECGAILSREGYSVCVVEKHTLFGGCLQSFQRKGHLIDTGMHYVGSMDQGQIMRQYLKYLGVFDQLDTIKLDPDFDVITMGERGVFAHMNGYEEFAKYLVDLFPREADGIHRYLNQVRQIGECISVDVHRSGRFTTGGTDFLSVSADEFINDCVEDTLLRSLLAGTNALYGGERERSNLYHHAMINHSNIEGAYRFVGGTQHVADSLVAKIESHGGVVMSSSEVVSIDVDGSQVRSVTLSDSRKILGKNFISNLHPAATFAMVGATPAIKKAYKSRLNLLPNTYGLFSVYLVMKPESFAYINKNHYYNSDPMVWDSVMGDDLRPKNVLMSSQLSCQGSRYGDVVTLMSPIANSVFEPWAATTLTMRDAQYRELKSRVTENMIDYTAQFCPQIKECIDSSYSASPLTYQHYTSTPMGSAYGILKDYRNMIATLLPPKTKLANLFLTGQNLNVHGALGVTLTAATTCAEFLGTEYLAKKVAEA